MLNLNSLLLFSDKPAVLAQFYEKVLGEKPGWTGDEYSGFKIGSSYLMIGPHDKVHGLNTNPERIMLNFETDDVEGEFERLKNLGAKVIAKPYHPMEDTQGLIATLADPDGNYFQLVTPMSEQTPDSSLN